MKKVLFTLSFAVLTAITSLAQIYHSKASFSYSTEVLYAKTIKANPVNPKILYMSAQHVNLSYKGFLDAYDISLPDSVKRTKRLGILTDSFGVTDFVFRGSDIYAIGSKGLQIINCITPENPVLTRNIKTVKDGTSTLTIGYFTASLLVDGNKMHYSGSNYYLIDISNLNSLTKLGEKSNLGINNGSIQKIGTNKVLASDGYDLNIMDVSAAPVITRTALSNLYGDPKQLLYDEPNKVLYTTFSTSSRNLLYSVNMNNNARIDSFNYLMVPGFNPSGHSGLFLFKDTLYVGTSLGVALFDVSTPGTLRFIGKLSTGGCNAIYVDEEFLVANDNYNLRFYRRGPAPVSSIAENTTLSGIELYPNPASNSVTLYLNQSNQPQLQLFDESGKLVLETMANENSQRHELALDGVQPGFYTMQIKTGDQVVNRKLVIE